MLQLLQPHHMSCVLCYVLLSCVICSISLLMLFSFCSDIWANTDWHNMIEWSRLKKTLWLALQDLTSVACFRKSLVHGQASKIADWMKTCPASEPSSKINKKQKCGLYTSIQKAYYLGKEASVNLTSREKLEQDRSKLDHCSSHNLFNPWSKCVRLLCGHVIHVKQWWIKPSTETHSQ